MPKAKPVPDTRALVEEFLRGDPEFARLLKEKKASDVFSLPPPALPPDHEVQALNRAKRRLFGPKWAFFFGVFFTCISFGRIISDTTWSASPRNFIASAAIAAVFWMIFIVEVLRARGKLLSRK